MFNSCRICRRPTDKWMDFCNECALSSVTSEPPLRVLPGGKSDRVDRKRRARRRETDEDSPVIRHLKLLNSKSTRT